MTPRLAAALRAYAAAARESRAALAAGEWPRYVAAQEPLGDAQWELYCAASSEPLEDDDDAE